MGVGRGLQPTEEEKVCGGGGKCDELSLIARKAWMEDRKEFFKAPWSPALAHQKNNDN